MESPRYVLAIGTPIRTHAHLNGTGGMLIGAAALARRQPNADGLIAGIVGGHGGDVYWVQHPPSTNGLAPYCFDEFELTDAVVVAAAPVPVPELVPAQAVPKACPSHVIAENRAQTELHLDDVRIEGMTMEQPKPKMRVACPAKRVLEDECCHGQWQCERETGHSGPHLVVYPGQWDEVAIPVLWTDNDPSEVVKFYRNKRVET